MDELDQATREAISRETSEHGKHLLEEIRFGIRCQQFIDSEIGRRLIEDAAEERRVLLEELGTLDYRHHAERMDQIRFELAVNNNWQGYIGQYIQRGRDSQQQYEAMEDHA